MATPLQEYRTNAATLTYKRIHFAGVGFSLFAEWCKALLEKK